MTPTTRLDHTADSPVALIKARAYKEGNSGIFIHLVIPLTLTHTGLGNLNQVVLPRSGSVRFFDYFGRTGNLTDGSVQANLVNPEPDLRFGSEGGPVPVQQWPNSEPNHIYSKKIEFIVNLII